MLKSKSIFLVLLSALGVAGELLKAGTLVEVSNADAKNLLHRNKARVAREDDGAPAGQDEEDDFSESDLAEAAAHRAMMDNELNADAWAKLSDKKRAALTKAAAAAIELEKT